MHVPDWWTPSDDEYLLDVYGTLTVAEIAGELGVESQFIRNRAVWLRQNRQNRRKEPDNG